MGTVYFDLVEIKATELKKQNSGNSLRKKYLAIY